jgi:hypothetical protein
MNTDNLRFSAVVQALGKSGAGVRAPLLAKEMLNALDNYDTEKYVSQEQKFWSEDFIDGTYFASVRAVLNLACKKMGEFCAENHKDKECDCLKLQEIVLGAL